MSDLNRLRRIVFSWTELYKPDFEDKQFYDAMMILTNQGYQMRAETLTWLTDSETRKEDYVQDILAAEKELNLDMVINFNEIDPDLSPKVYEEDGKVIFTISEGKEEIVYCEMELPENLKVGTFKPKAEESQDAAGTRGPIDVAID